MLHKNKVVSGNFATLQVIAAPLVLAAKLLIEKLTRNLLVSLGFVFVFCFFFFSSDKRKAKAPNRVLVALSQVPLNPPNRQLN